MALTSRLPGQPNLALHSLRRHRGAVLAWILAGGGIMWVFGAAYNLQVSTFAGGAKAFAVTATAAAEAMRVLVGPTDRLDTYGGYVTFHNLGYATLLLGFWALVAGSRAIRGAEEKGELAGWLAAGRTRARLVVERTAGFVAAVFLVAVGVGVMTWLGTVAAGQPAFFPSLGAIAEVCLGASIFFALALFVSQLAGSSRTSSGIAGAVMLASYLVANLNPNMGWWAWLKYLSPFWYVQQSRTLIPGHGLDLGATLVLVVAFLGLTAAAGWAFSRRDIGAPLLRSRRGAADVTTPFRARRPWLATTWTADLRSQRTGLAFWFIGAVVWFALYVGVASTILDYWTSSELLRRLFAAVPAASLADQYVGYVVNLTSPLLAAFALVQAARWVRDVDEGRTEMVLSTPTSRMRLWLERMLGLAVGAGVVIGGCLVGLVIGAGSAHVDLSGPGVMRTAADLLLLTLATGAVAALIVATVRSSAAIGALGAFLGLSFFVTVFGPLLSWPEWAMRLSVFQAFGTPYLAPVAIGDALFAGGLALVAGAAALVVARRRSTAC